METLDYIDKFDEKCTTSDSTVPNFDKHNSYFQNDDDTRFHIEHKWEGRITDVYDDHFLAQMYNIDDDEWDELRVPRSEINIDDQSLVQEGALLELFIGMSEKGGTQKREKKLKFRRIYLGNRIDQILDSFNSNSFSDLFEEY